MVGIVLGRNERKSESDEDRLLKLFRNRSELKKEFAKLRESGEILKEQLQEQEGATLRSQQQLQQLERLLAHPVQAANASVFYQLKGVWGQCHRKLSRLSEHLLSHRRDQEIKFELNRFNASKKAELSAIGNQLKDAKRRFEKVEAELEGLKLERSNARGFWNIFRRAKLRRSIEALTIVHNNAKGKLKEYLDQVREKDELSPPEYGELSIEGRRSINLMLIAIAQELYLHFSLRKVSGLAREASVREVTEVNYGDINACRDMNIHIEKCIRNLPSGEQLVPLAAQRVAYLEKCASYRMDSDTVPVAGSFSEIPINFGDDGSITGKKTIKVNVLADEYWDIYKVLLI